MFALESPVYKQGSMFPIYALECELRRNPLDELKCTPLTD